MTLKTKFKLVLNYYNYGEIIYSIPYEYDHYPTEEEMLNKVREHESSRKTVQNLKLTVEKVYEVKR